MRNAKDQVNVSQHALSKSSNLRMAKRQQKTSGNASNAALVSMLALIQPLNIVPVKKKEYYPDFP